MKGTTKAGAAVVGLIAAIGVGVAHELGAFVDDAGRAGGRVLEEHPPVVPRNPGLPGEVYDALKDPGVSGSVKSGISVFRSLRKGEDDDKVIVGAACKGFDAFASEQATEQDYKRYIEDEAASLVPRIVVTRYSSKLANGMYAAQLNGGLARWYTQYCIVSSR